MGKPGQKVARVLERYGISGDVIATLWGHEDDAKRKSLRELADYINTEIVRTVVDTEADGMTPSEYPPERIAYLLRARASTASRFEDAPQGEISEVTNWLESREIDTDELTESFVTFGVVHDYLKNFQDAEASERYQKTTDPAELKRTVTKRFRGLEDQFKTVAEESFRSLENAGVLDDIDREVTVTVAVTCLRCGREYPAAEFVDEDGCRICAASSESMSHQQG